MTVDTRGWREHHGARPAMGKACSHLLIQKGWSWPSTSLLRRGVPALTWARGTNDAHHVCSPKGDSCFSTVRPVWQQCLAPLSSSIWATTLWQGTPKRLHRPVSGASSRSRDMDWAESGLWAIMNPAGAWEARPVGCIQRGWA